MSLEYEVKELRVLVERKCSPHRRRMPEPGGVVTKPPGGMGVKGSSLVRDSRSTGWGVARGDGDNDHARSGSPRVVGGLRTLRGQVVVPESQWKSEGRKSEERGSVRKSQKTRKTQKVTATGAMSSDSNTESVDEDSELMAVSDASDTMRMTRSKGVVGVHTEEGVAMEGGRISEGDLATGGDMPNEGSPEKPAEELKRGRGRPRKYPIGQAPYVLKKLQRLKQRSLLRSKRKHSLSTRGRSLLDAGQTSESSESEIERKTRARKRSRANYASLVSNETVTDKKQDEDYVPVAKKSRPSPSKSSSAHPAAENPVVRGTDLASILTDIPDVSIVPNASITVDVETTSMGHRVHTPPQPVVPPYQRNSDPPDNPSEPPVSVPCTQAQPSTGNSVVKRLNLRNTADRRSRASSSLNATPTSTPTHSPMPAKEDGTSSVKSGEGSRPRKGTSVTEDKSGGKSRRSGSNTRGLSSHFRFLMSLKDDCGRGSNSTRGSMLYVFEHYPEMLRGNEPWIDKARMIWNMWRSKVPEHIRKKYIERAKQNKKKFLGESGSVPSPRQVANQRRDTARKLSAFTPMTSRLKETSPLQLKDPSDAAMPDVTRRSSYSKSQESFVTDKSGIVDQGRSRSKSLSACSTSEILATFPSVSFSTLSQGGNSTHPPAMMAEQTLVRPGKLSSDGRAVEESSSPSALALSLAGHASASAVSNIAQKQSSCVQHLESGSYPVGNAVLLKSGSHAEHLNAGADTGNSAGDQSSSSRHVNSLWGRVPEEMNGTQTNSAQSTARDPSRNDDHSLNDQPVVEKTRGIQNPASSEMQSVPLTSDLIDLYSDQVIASILQDSLPTPFKACPASLLLSHTALVSKEKRALEKAKKPRAKKPTKKPRAQLVNGSDVSAKQIAIPSVSGHEGSILVQKESVSGVPGQDASKSTDQTVSRSTAMVHVSVLGQGADLTNWPGIVNQGVSLSGGRKHPEITHCPSNMLAGISMQAQSLISGQSNVGCPENVNNLQARQNGVESEPALDGNSNSSGQVPELPRNSNVVGEVAPLSRKSNSSGQHAEELLRRSDIPAQKQGLSGTSNVAGQAKRWQNKTGTSAVKTSKLLRSNTSRQTGQAPRKSQLPEQGSVIPMSQVAQTVADLPRGLNATAAKGNSLSSVPDISILKERLSGSSNIMEQLADLHEQLRASCQTAGISEWDKDKDVHSRPKISGQREKVGQRVVLSDKMPEALGRSSMQKGNALVNKPTMAGEGSSLYGVAVDTSGGSHSAKEVDSLPRTVNTLSQSCQSMISGYGNHLPLEALRTPATISVTNATMSAEVTPSRESDEVLKLQHTSNGDVSESTVRVSNATSAGFSKDLWQNNTSCVTALSSNGLLCQAHKPYDSFTVEAETVLANSATFLASCGGAVVSIIKVQNSVVEPLPALDDNEDCESELSNASRNQDSMSSSSGQIPNDVRVDTPDDSCNSDKFTLLLQLQESPQVNLACSPVQAVKLLAADSSFSEYCVGVEKVVNPVLASPEDINALCSSSDLLSGIVPLSPISKNKSFASPALPPSSQLPKTAPISSNSYPPVSLSMTVVGVTSSILSSHTSTLPSVTSSSLGQYGSNHSKQLSLPNVPLISAASTGFRSHEGQPLASLCTAISSFSNSTTSCQNSFRLPPPFPSLSEPAHGKDNHTSNPEAPTTSKKSQNQICQPSASAVGNNKKRPRKKQAKKTTATSKSEGRNQVSNVYMTTTSASGYSITTQQYSSVLPPSSWQANVTSFSSTTGVPQPCLSYSSASHHSANCSLPATPSQHRQNFESSIKTPDPTLSPHPYYHRPPHSSNFIQPHAPSVSSSTSSMDIHFPSSLRETCRAIHKVSSFNPIRMYDDEQPINGGIEATSSQMESHFREIQEGGGHGRRSSRAVSIVSPVQSTHSSFPSQPPSRPSSVSSGRNSTSPAISSHVQNGIHQNYRLAVGRDREVPTDWHHRRQSREGLGEVERHNHDGRDPRRWLSNGHSDGPSHEFERAGFRPYSRTGETKERRSLSVSSDSSRAAMNGQAPFPDQHSLLEGTREGKHAASPADMLVNSSAYHNRRDSLGHITPPSSVSTHVGSLPTYSSSSSSSNSSSKHKRSQRPLKAGPPLISHNSSVSPMKADSPQVYFREAEADHSSRPVRRSHASPMHQRPLSSVSSPSFAPGESQRHPEKNQALVFHHYYQSSTSSPRCIPPGPLHDSRQSPLRRTPNADQPFGPREPSSYDITKMTRWELEELHYYIISTMKRHRQLLQSVEEQLRVLDSRCNGPPPPRLTPKDMHKRFLSMAMQPDCSMEDDESYREKFGYGPGGENLGELIIGGTPEAPIINPKYDVYGNGNKQVQS